MRVASGAWKTLWRGALDLLLPGACVVCRRAHAPDSAGIVCPGCLAGITPLSYPQCVRCGQPQLSLSVPLPTLRADDHARHGRALPSASEVPPCRWCARLSPAIRAVRSAARMDSGTGGELVHALKYRGWWGAAQPMARTMARLNWPRDVTTERAALGPVPLSATRLRERGYNQAESLARALAPHWCVPVWTDVLARTRSTQSQVRLTPSERASNVSRAFAVPLHRRAELRGQHLVLVDDVVTTAATLNAAVQALVEGGARIISCVTFGRAPDPGDRAAPDSDFIRN